ncbi:non-specific lipid-transfer protein-like protein At5g64080 [Punica granatum]|uniref:Bifunctional inhibitor/plant lipid transfer protein/seed storage helical domain-containing protein n=2 Tax=Punica granatum TaxID=22663 RepID=A0A218XT05_PUNGR|nr:non-specific lipid-transfer protein-like protein At5g64080 [Punica granatum]OWM87749.1 hypothetical protein CDL15_Pgr016445 [Punica granatum]PKI63338.1 hypothetical protein CRG98_016226 [Punica granatum]
MAMPSRHYAILTAMAVLFAAAADYRYCVLGASSPHAPAPAVDCSSLVLTMADCLSFVSNGSTVDKPEGTCCSGLKTVLKTNAECLCEAFRSSAQLGVILNVTKALALPSACKVPAASAKRCDLSIAPASSPVLAPESSPAADSSAAPATSEPAAASDEVSAPVPAPSQGTSGSSGIIASFGLLSSSLAISLLLF